MKELAQADHNVASSDVTDANGKREGLESAPAKKRRQLSSLPRSQQCALTCQDIRFWIFMGEEYKETILDPIGAAQSVRDILGVVSRAEIDRDLVTASGWAEMYGRFQCWLTDRIYSELGR